MTSGSHSAERLAGLLGSSRSDRKVHEFIAEFEPPPAITIDIEDDADDEFVEFRAHGFGLAFDHGVLQAFHLHDGASADSYARYELPLPLCFSFDQSEADVLARHPQPDAVGGGRSGTFGHVPRWMRYDDPRGSSVHLEFSPESGRLQKVTVFLAEKKG